jgi:imidazoleglycerol-phosphate dehydratase/histidinol-phosphatase
VAIKILKIMKDKYIFIDRDGTIIKEPPDEQIDSLEKLEFVPGVIRNLYRLTRFSGYKLVMVSNQDGLGTDSYPEQDFEKVQDTLLQTLSGEGIEFDSVRIDKSTADASSPDRKPATGLIRDYLEKDLDRERSVVIGDRLSDVELAYNAGIKAIWLSGDKEKLTNELESTCLSVTGNWDKIFSVLNSLTRAVNFSRNTKETDITGKLEVDGSGEAEIHTGLGFFDHMLEQVARHGNMDLALNVKGDLHVDEHHTVEDTGLALGAAFREALQNKKGLSRYGFYVPMDESLASCVLDFGGRPYLVWDAEFRREKIGDLPSELFEHFFHSFADQARCTIHITCKGKNEHHKIEAIFKAFARALREAVKQDVENYSLPSTKGAM